MAKSHKTDKILRHQFSPAVASNSAAYSSPLILQSSVYASIRSEALRWVSLRLSAMFDRADDVFFEKAQKVFSNQEQETYFAAMREMRLIRKSAEKEVFENLSTHFANLPNPDSSMHIPKMEVVDSFESLSLMACDELEENVAFDAMVLRARSEHGEQFSHLMVGLNAILSHVDVTLDTLPIAPKQLCDAFRCALTHMDCAIECKLVIYKLFEKELLNQLSDLLKRCNTVLKEAGITTAVSRQEKTSGAFLSEQVGELSNERKEGEPLANSGNNPGRQQTKTIPDNQSLISLLTQGRYCTSTGAYLEAADHRGLPGHPASNDLNAKANTIAIEDLIASLSGLQHEHFSQSQSDRSDNSATVTRLPVESMLVERHQRTHASEEKHGISSIDSEAINFVTMIFDFILNDISLPLPVKALLSKLQIPMIKVAVLDRSFFTSAVHPARKLLNDMGRAGISLSEEKGKMEDDLIYVKISNIVETISEEFDSNLELFSELGEDFSIFLQAEAKRAALLEKRILAAEEGKAASEHAEITAVNVVERSIASKQIPLTVKNILEEHWVKVLRFSYLQGGEDGRDFQKKCEISKHIVRSVIPPKSLVEKQFIESMTPMLLKRLGEGLGHIGIDDIDSKNIVEKLRVAQENAIATFSNAKHRVHKSEVSVEKSPQSSGNKRVPSTSALQSMAQDVLEKSDQILNTAEAKVSGSEKVVPIMIRVGAWVSVSSDGENNFEPALRCKLAAHIKKSDRLIFVDRRGRKVLELCSFQLEQSIINKHLTVVEEGLVFERALENIVDSLRTTQAIELASQN
jgi:hypothetical protein